MRKNGFSLIDLLTTIMVAGVLISSAVPSLISTYKHTQSTTYISTVLGALKSARNHAISQGTEVFICGSNSLTQCDKTWSNALIAFLDHDKNRTLSDDDEVLFVRQLDIQSGFFYSRVASGMKHTQFNALGAVKYAGSMVYCPKGKNKKYAHRATWNRLGRSYRALDKNGDGYIDDTSQNRISCHN